MSSTAFEQSKETRRRCQSCQERKARFRYRGVVKADRDHTLCFECYRAERERRRAQLLTPGPSEQTPVPEAPLRPALNARRVAHRLQMLRHLRANGRG